MFSIALRTAGEVFAQAKPNGQFGRVGSAYEDVAALASLYAEQQPRAHWDGRDLSEAEARAMFGAGRAADALHRAVVQAACVAMTVLLHEVLDHPKREMTVPRFLRSARARRLAEQPSWSTLYCLTVYRNKLIVHHEVPRMPATKTSAEGVRRLVPMRQGFAVDDEDLRALYGVRDRTGVAAGEPNYFALLMTLFYRLPACFGTAQSPDRRLVEAIAERGGVDSLSVQEIAAALTGVLGDLPVLCAK